MSRRFGPIFSAFVAGFIMLLPGSVSEHNKASGVPGTAGGGWFLADEDKNTFGFILDRTDPNASSLVFQGRDKGVVVQSVEFGKIWFSKCKNDGSPTVHAKGHCLVNGSDGWKFHLKATDKGDGSLDRCWLRVGKVQSHDGSQDDGSCPGGDSSHDDGSCSGHEDATASAGEASAAGAETTGCDCAEHVDDTSCGTHDDDGGCTGSDGSPMFHWKLHGLDGGNVWVSPDVYGSGGHDDGSSCPDADGGCSGHDGDIGVPTA